MDRWLFITRYVARTLHGPAMLRPSQSRHEGIRTAYRSIDLSGDSGDLPTESAERLAIPRAREERGEGLQPRNQRIAALGRVYERQPQQLPLQPVQYRADQVGEGHGHLPRVRIRVRVRVRVRVGARARVRVAAAAQDVAQRQPRVLE